MKKIELSAIIPEELAGQRLDQALAKLFSDYSRAQLQQWILQGAVKVDDNHQLKPRQKVSAGQQIALVAELTAQQDWQAQSIPLDIVHQDEHLIVINKPAGLIVHPGAGHPDSTLANALLHHYPELAQLPRSGIVHRLDKDTSGLLVIARSLPAHHQLVQMIQQRQITRQYDAIVYGQLIAGGTVDAAIGRHPKQRTQMAVVKNGKPAITHYRILKRFEHHTYLRVCLETGRTHQIRVHMAYINHPIVGDQTYRQRRGHMIHFHRQALHARLLSFQHPITQQELQLTADLPQDIQDLLIQLESC